jgi:hypothetical protein
VLSGVTGWIDICRAAWRLKQRQIRKAIKGGAVVAAVLPD